MITVVLHSNYISVSYILIRTIITLFQNSLVNSYKCEPKPDNMLPVRIQCDNIPSIIRNLEKHKAHTYKVTFLNYVPLSNNVLNSWGQCDKIPFIMKNIEKHEAHTYKITII